jgi:endonuclease-8
VPEGDTIFRAARTLHRVLAGKKVTRFESVYPALTRIADDRPIVGRTIESVSARGKHLLIAFSGDLILRTHMRMNGSWHIYPTGARWRRSARDMRVLVGTHDAVAVGFNVPDAELLTEHDLARHKHMQALGPDLLADAGTRASLFDRAEVLRRFGDHGRDAIADALLNQRIVAGIGNVFKSEILFLAGIDPFTPVSALAEGALDRVIDISRRQLASNVMSRSQTLSPAFGRRTTRRLDPRERLWVYGRGGKPCRQCGAVIQSKKTGLDARLTYWCPACQRSSSAR